MDVRKFESVTYADAMLLLETVVKLLQCLRRIRVVADLHKLDAELARGDPVRFETTSGVNDDHLGIVGC